jgi:hypothetical protein
MQQNDIYNIPLPRGPGPKNKNKRQRTWDKLPVWIKKTPDSSRGHKISTRNGSVIGSDLTYKFEKLYRSSQEVFVSKNQTKVRASSCRDKPSNENLEQNAHARVQILQDNLNEQSFSNVSTG